MASRLQQPMRSGSRCRAGVRCRRSVRTALFVVVVGNLTGMESSRWLTTGGPALADAPPTDSEVACIEWANAVRRNPGRVSDVLLARARFALPLTLGPVDWHRCRSELVAGRPAPYLVINPALYTAARNHAHHLLAHAGSGSGESTREAGYASVSPYMRMAAAGYRGVSIGETPLMTNTMGPALLAMLVDPGSGAGGMAPLRVRRTSLLDYRANEAGLSLVGGGGSSVAVMNYGRCYAPRLLGGVIYRDANRNGRYDPGEGVGGVRVTTSHEGLGGTCSWSSGGLRLELSDRMSFRCTASHDGKTYTRAFDAGVEPAWLEWRLPQDDDHAVVEGLIAAVEGAQGPARDRAAIHLWCISRGCGCSAEQERRIAALCESVVGELAAARSAVRAALYWQDAQRFASALASRSSAYRDTAAARWFIDARRIAPVYRRAGALAAALRGGAAANQALLAALDRELALVAGDLQASEFLDLASAITGFLAAVHDQTRTVQR